MVLSDIHSAGGGSAIDDIAYLARSAHRVSALTELTERPRSRSELCELTGVSSSTVRRALGEFEDRAWVQKDGYRYEATPLGEAIADGIEELTSRVETERELRDVWHWLPDAVLEYALEGADEVTVTVAEHDAPYRPVNRYRSLFRATDTYRFVGFGVGLYEPCKNEFQRRVLDGMEAEIIDPPRVVRYMLSTYPDRSAVLLESNNFTALSHDDVPTYGVCLFDDRIAVTGYDPDSSGVPVLIDTDMPAAREWAESVYATYKSDAWPVDPKQIEAGEPRS